MRKYLLWIVFSALHITAFAQEPPVYSQFFINPYIYNSAYAGVDGHTVISAMYRQQWTGLSGAPALSHVTFHTPLQGGLGIGAFAFNERQSVLSTSGIKGTVSYLANFDRKHWLRFGLSLGAGSDQLDMDELDNPFDPAFANLADNSFYAIGDFGVTYHSGNFNFGVSLPDLFGRDIITQDSFERIDFKPYENVFIKANYHLGFLNDDFVWEPHLLYRYSGESADQYEIANIIHVAHHIWFGASWRQDAGLVGLFGIKVKEKLAIGYAFELGDSEVNSFTGQTHEVHIGFHLGSKKEHAEHVSSFIKRHRKTADERRQEAEERRLARLAGEPDPNENSLLQTNNDPVTETQPDVADNPDLTENPDAGVDPGGTPPVVGTDPGGVAPGVTTDPQGVDPATSGTQNVNPVGTNNQTVAGTNNPIDPSLTNDNRTPEQLAESDTPLRVKRGNHLLELGPGNYVINGAFRTFENAENFSDTLFERGFHDVIVGYVTATGYYYVVVQKAADLKSASSRASRLRGRQGFEKTWVLSVE